MQISSKKKRVEYFELTVDQKQTKLLTVD